MTVPAHTLVGEPRRRRRLPGSFPWRRPRRERWVLVLVALATLTPVYAISSQDLSRLCLSRAILAGRLTIAPCVGAGVDRARYHGQIYSDKPPGVSILALPAVELTGLPDSHLWPSDHEFDLWLVRVFTGGIAFLLLVFALGRVTEGIAPGTGAFVAVTFALGTLAGGLAATTFDQIPAAALGFGAFVLAWRGHPGRAGLLAGLAVTVEYQTALIAALVAVYLALGRRGRLHRYLAGTLLGGLLLAAYDWASFGSPFHLSYRYVANQFTRQQHAGFFGITLPRWHALTTVLIGHRGLLVVSPVVLAAGAGLLLLSRRYGREAAICAAVSTCFLTLEAGYFLPYGGVSPGPRFLVPALPFLALGLAPAFQRFKLLTGTLALISIVAATTLALTWSREGSVGYRQTVWDGLLRALVRTHTRLAHALANNLLTFAGLTPLTSALFVVGCAVVGVTVAAWSSRDIASRHTSRPHTEPEPLTDTRQ